MSKWIATAVFTALVLITGFASAAAVSAHDSATGNVSPNSGRKVPPTRTSTPTRVPTLVPTLPPTSTPAYSPSPSPTPEPTIYVDAPLREQDTIRLINQRRAAMGLGTLRTNSTLTTAARRLSYDIGPLGLCQHNGTDGSWPSTRVIAAGYAGNYYGEVLGCGFPTSQTIVDAWWNSPQHYSILTYAGANDIGCGWWVDSTGSGWATCDVGVGP